MGLQPCICVFRVADGESERNRAVLAAPEVFDVDVALWHESQLSAVQDRGVKGLPFESFDPECESQRASLMSSIVRFHSESFAGCAEERAAA